MPIIKKKIKINKISNCKNQFEIKNKKSHKKSFKKLKKRLYKVKHTNWFKAFKWDLLKFDFTKFLGRNYYLFKFILQAILDIISILLVAFQTWTILLFFVPLGLMTLNSIREVIQDFSYRVKNKMFNSSLTNAARCAFSSGPPGTGKTSSKVYEAKQKASVMWKKLQEAYFFCLSVDRSKLNENDQVDYDEIVDSYNYYLDHPDGIPCLWSNIAIWDDQGCKSFKLKKKHLLQYSRLPFYSVLFSDEIGCMFKAKKGSNDALDTLSEFARFIRHFIDGFWDFTEQDADKAFIDIRRSAGSNKYLQQQKWVLKPYFICTLYDILLDLSMYDFNFSKLYKNKTSQKNSHLKKATKSSKRCNRFLKWLKKLISCIGWRKYTFNEKGNPINDNDKREVESGLKTFYLPSCLNCKYDDRAYRNKYLPKRKKIEGETFKNKFLSLNDIEEIFSDVNEELNSNTKTKMSK